MSPYSVLLVLMVTLVPLSTCLHWHYYKDQLGTRMVKVYHDNVNGELQCRRYGHRTVINRALSHVSAERISTVDNKEMKMLLRLCDDLQIGKDIVKRSHEITVNITSRFDLIYPGTKWCGTGNVADHIDDLGRHDEADMCCRDHDHCEDHMEAGESKHGLVNSFGVTISHCDCDDQFRQCLENGVTSVSKTIGRIFFNLIAMPCYKFEHPQVSCLQWGGLGNSRCQDYHLDYSQSKKWQFFDAIAFGSRL